MKPIMNPKDATNHQHVLSQSIKKQLQFHLQGNQHFFPPFFVLFFLPRLFRRGVEVETQVGASREVCGRGLC